MSDKTNKLINKLKETISQFNPGGWEKDLSKSSSTEELYHLKFDKTQKLSLGDQPGTITVAKDLIVKFLRDPANKETIISFPKKGLTYGLGLISFNLSEIRLLDEKEEAIVKAGPFEKKASYEDIFAFFARLKQS